MINLIVLIMLCLVSTLRCEGILTVVITIHPLPQPWVETK